MEVFPVVHINNPNTAIEQAALALDSGADGVYLIDHRSDEPNTLFETFQSVRAERPEAFIGVNILGYGALDALTITQRAQQSGMIDQAPDGLWVDDIVERYSGNRTGEAMRLKEGTEALKHLKILGGIAFKYTPSATEHPGRASYEAVRLHSAVDVITTSGTGTGSSPSVEKIAAMKAIADRARKPLAVASGISIENMDHYHGIVDQVLVASSIETTSYSGIFVESRLKDFIDKAHEEQSER